MRNTLKTCKLLVFMWRAYTYIKQILQTNLARLGVELKSFKYPHKWKALSTGASTGFTSRTIQRRHRQLESIIATPLRVDWQQSSKTGRRIGVYLLHLPKVGPNHTVFSVTSSLGALDATVMSRDCV